MATPVASTVGFVDLPLLARCQRPRPAKSARDRLLAEVPDMGIQQFCPYSLYAIDVESEWFMKMFAILEDDIAYRSRGEGFDLRKYLALQNTLRMIGGDEPSYCCACMTKARATANFHMMNDLYEERALARYDQGDVEARIEAHLHHRLQPQTSKYRRLTLEDCIPDLNELDKLDGILDSPMTSDQNQPPRHDASLK